ncbi:MAG: hypothetical protein KIH65_002825 [Candidatus Uhrbacteria bacterium]|nr:hypothetical protein [Candidatus Uhrbacteria bacterium]
MSSRPSFFWKSVTAITIIVSAFAGPIASQFLIPQARAEGEGSGGIRDTPTVVPCGVGVWCTDMRAAQEIDKVKERLDFQIMFPLYMGVLNAVTIAAQQLAYDSAEWVASGFKGNGPLIEIFTNENYIKQIGLDAAGEFLGTFSEQFTEGMFGINLCRPPRFQGIDLQFALSIPDFAINGIKRPKPKCAWTQIVSNWNATADSLDNAVALHSIKSSFNIGGNDIAYGIGLNTAFFDTVAQKKEAGVLDRLEGRGFKSVQDMISGNVRTPASVVEENVKEQIIRQPNAAENVKTTTLLQNTFKLGAMQIGTVMISTFSNVLVTRLLGRLTKGLLSSGTSGISVPDLLSSGAAPLLSQSGRSEEIFASQFREILTPNIASSEQQDILGEMLGCPDNGRTKWNCSIDSTLEAALRKNGHMTVRQAIDSGFINEQWELIPSTQAKDNLDPGCAQRAFCAANIRKMRLARIVPIGWELAADSAANQQKCQSGSGCMTLAEVLQHFDDCNDAGELDAAHPWCHLIDPNWVLTSFPTQCLTKGYGNSFLAGTNQRLQECQDTVSCLERDAAGKCVGGYGYCMAEQTFWQFDAESCQEQYVSCRTYTPRGSNAKPIGYLRSTVDYGSCNDTNVGCMWYANTRDTSVAARDNANAWNATYSGATGKTYFDKTISRCDGQYDGCTDLRRVTNGKPSLNLIRNGSFEETNDKTGVLTGWVHEPTAFFEDATPVPYQEPSIASGAAAMDGARGYIPRVAPSIHEVVRLAPGRQYTFSFYARGIAGNTRSAGATLHFYRADPNNPDTPPSKNSSFLSADTTFYRSATCASGAIPLYGTNSGQVHVLLPAALSSDWQRFECSFVAPPETAWSRIFLIRGDGDPWLADGVKLEASETATAFNDGLNPALPSVSMKVPPAELNCTGNDSADHPLCQKFARVCKESEAGCQGYRPKGQSGAPEIPAVLTAADACPSECVGYAEFRKQASPFDLVRNTEVSVLDDPEDQSIAAFVPSSARLCSAQDIGCESFTNLKTEEASGFSYLRSCEQPNDSTQTYYTWEGSEASGYQLVTWSLQRDTNAALPQGPLLLRKTGPDGSVKDPATCNALSYVTALDPDCRQFYDPQGNVFYQFESQTILADTACTSFRKEGSTRADCEKTGGAFSADTNQCVYQAVPEKSRVCALTVAGCRAYIGTRGQVRLDVFSEDFAKETYAVNPGSAAPTLNTSEESVLVGDRSLRIQMGGSGTGNVTFDVPTQPGLLYELEFWGKTSSPSPVNVRVWSWDMVTGSEETVIGDATLRSSWGVYRIGPFTGSASTNGMTRIQLSGFNASPSFIDTIRVTQVTDVAYAVRDSWNTPASCDRTPEGVYQSQAMLGCQEYVDRNNTVSTLRQFTRLCRESAIGCSAFINTENSESPYEQRWERSSVGRTEVTARKADHFEYYIESKDAMCPKTQISCRAFGLPKFNQDRLTLDGTQAFETVYLKDDVTKYDDAICTESELFCEAFSFSGGGKSGTEYFRAPSDHACEYKTGAVVATMQNGVAAPSTAGCDLPNPGQYVGATYDGWFKVGTECPCYPAMLRRGSTFGIMYAGDQTSVGSQGYNPWNGSMADRYTSPQTYEGWTGVCPATQAECSEFRDIADTSDPAHPQGRPYFVINDERLDKESCNGKVDPGRGCVLFRDTSDTSLKYDALATFDDYKTRGYQPVAPIDCVAQPQHPSCLRSVISRTNDVVRALSGNATSASFNACVTTQLEHGIDTDAARANCAGVENGNNSNIILKVKPDRSCSQWLACKTGETVYDQQTGQYKSICSELALCNDAKATDQGEGIPFCTGYVNRTSNSLITILKKYRVVDAATYASRAVGFGAVDYSGFTIPNHFQVMDATLKPIAAMLSPDPAIAAKFKKDYRLAVSVPISSNGARVPTTDEGRAFSGTSMASYACVFPQTNSYGVRTNAAGTLDANGSYCWLPLDQSPPAQVGVSGASLVADNLNGPSLIGRFGQTENPNIDQILSRSFPNTQCKAAPQPDSPFSNDFVLEWDDSTNPPEPSRSVSGYGNANFCEYGEDCSCVYKRVKYGGGRSKFYEPLSTNVVNAVCQGGPRDGLPCVPSSGIQGSQAVNVSVTTPSADGETPGTQTVSSGGGINAQRNADNRCGEGGTCMPISDVQLVRGVTGQCLEYDASRPVAGDSTRSECLVWNPTPVLAGPGDQYHWSPTAGFQAPQSSGRYYCSSPVRAPREQPFNSEAAWPKDIPDEGFDWESVALAAVFPQYLAAMATNDLTNLALNGNAIDVGGACNGGEDNDCKHAIGPWPNSEGNYAGRIKALFYADWFTSDGSCTNFLFWGGCTGNEGGASLDGHRADGTQEGGRCEAIDDEDQAFVVNQDAMRLVTTGQGSGRSYAEYAILFNPSHIAYAALGSPPQDWETVMDYSLEDSVANFTFSVPKGKIGCGYSEAWADVHVDDYDDEKDKWGGTDDQWHATFQKFLQEGGGLLNRSTAKVVTEDGSPGGLPVKVDCVIRGGSGSPDNRSEDGTCFIKTWELNYRAAGQQKFQAFTPDIGRNGLDHLSRRPLYGKCESAHPWFSIRAVFEDTSPSENDLSPEEVTADRLVGPFQFVGLWVTACAPGDQTRYIYMKMNMNSADVCRELLETTSKDSHETVAFTDRNNANSGYSMKNGFSWNSMNIPFGASLATGDAGIQPLFMTGVAQKDVNPTNPPTFTSPGQTYFTAAQYPTSKWGMLSNVFAKIYRIYGYYARGVSRSDYACTDPRSPQFGQWCPPVANMTNGEELSRQYCGLQGKCLRGGLNGSDIFQQHVCNAFSGVNRGLDCSSDPDICHKAPMEDRNGVLTPSYGQCQLFAGYHPVSGSAADTVDGTTTGALKQEIDVRWTQMDSGRFRCEGAQCPTECVPTASTYQTGCSRSVAIQNGAFRCQGSVRDPQDVKETIDGRRTFASYCTRESRSSSECPTEILTGTCNDNRCEGHPWAQCTQDSDCHFMARNYWPSGAANNFFYWTRTGYEDSGLGQHVGKLNQDTNGRNSDYIPHGENFFYVFERGGTLNDDMTWFTRSQTLTDGTVIRPNNSAYAEAFWPALPMGYDMGGGALIDSCDDDDGICFYATRINSITSAIGDNAILTYARWDDTPLLALYPGFNPHIWWYTPDGLVSDNLNSNYAGSDAREPLQWARVNNPNDNPDSELNDNAPYVSVTQTGDYDGDSPNIWAHYGACESLPLMYREGASASQNRPILGLCRGGGRDGEACAEDVDCRPADLSRADFDDLQDEAGSWCNPVTNGNNPDAVGGIYGGPSSGDANACWPTGSDTAANRPARESDPAKDSNICTHPAGYWPRPQFCKDPNDEYCGLFGYALTDASNSIRDDRPLPTDVTPGLSSPRYLRPGAPESEMSPIDGSYSYVDYYNPTPPHTGAPDPRTCQGSQCRIASLDTFSVNGVAEGVVNGGSGSHVATIRFYGWAAHEQMPLRRVIVDWGDGTRSELPDAYLKNRKPYCQTAKECTETSGLTCQTDADCPPGGGQCVTMGNCSNSANTRCWNDSQCNIGGEQGFCESRVAFGSDGNACEEQYFEFRHAFSCLTGSGLTTCSAGGRCSRDPNRTCSDASGCAPGDACITNTAQSSGCFDNSTQSCRFTPRILLVDNWGWCSGECRATVDSRTQKPMDVSGSAIRHPNGGCFDASLIKSNVSLMSSNTNTISYIGPNECAPDRGTDSFGSENTRRPWIVFPGSLQIRQGEGI